MLRIAAHEERLTYSASVCQIRDDLCQHGVRPATIWNSAIWTILFYRRLGSAIMLWLYISLSQIPYPGGDMPVLLSDAYYVDMQQFG